MTINVKGKIVDFSSPIVMGILNVTPDSFYDGGKFNTKDEIANQVGLMIAEGVDIIDVGGMSSRPGAEIISPQQEIDRVSPTIEFILKNHPEQVISIDTMHSKTADVALSKGAHIVNDISGGSFDSAIIDIAIHHRAPYILMHMQGTPDIMQEKPMYDDVVLDIIKELSFKVRKLKKQGLHDIIIDPGFGFGKTLEHNYTLLQNLSQFRILGCPILAGISRKSMIYRPLDISPEQALSATSALHMVALTQGAKILRVHDVKEAKECIRLFQLLHHQ